MNPDEISAIQEHHLFSTSSSSSPLSLSPNGSDAGTEEDDDVLDDDAILAEPISGLLSSSVAAATTRTMKNNSTNRNNIHDKNKRNKFRPLTFDEVEQSLDKYYYDEETAARDTSSELDILITYLKGQKNLHLQSKSVCEFWLNSLLVPTLLITTAITICAPFLQVFPWSGGFISGLNATTAFLISLVKFLKLESAVEMFHNTVNQYDKLETSVEFTTSKLLFVVEPEQRTRIVLEKIQDIEKKVSEIKEWNSQIVPSEVLRAFPIICNVNIFSFIKRVESAKRGLIAKFKDVKNEIRYIEYKMMQNGQINVAEKNKYSRRLDHLLDIKDKMKEELLHHRQAYCHIDQIFTQEIRSAQQRRAFFWIRCLFSLCCGAHDSTTFATSATSAASAASTNSVVDRFLVQSNPYVVVTLP